MGDVSCLNDVYGLGVCCYEMCFKRLPYIRNVNNLHSIAKFVTEVKYNALVFPQNHQYSTELINLISSML
jgi:serine/threonine protein kinase